MTTFTRRRFTWVALAIVLGAASCDKSPARPATIPPPNSPAPPTVIPSSFQITVPPTIAPGSSVLLKATVTKSDGSTEDVTEKAEWKSTDERVLKVSAQGLASALQAGRASLHVYYHPTQRTANVFVLPDGTFAVWGRARDGALELPGVTIEVIRGTGQGASVVSDEKGDFWLFGLAGPIELHAKKDGFRNERRELVVTKHQQTADLGMAFEGTRAALAGQYTMTLTRGCPQATLPATRSYLATIEQNDSELSVRLGEADFVVNNGRGDRFIGAVASDGGVTFEIGQGTFDYYYPVGPFDLVERFSASQSLLVYGHVRAKTTAEGISGSMLGMIALSSKFAEPFHPYTSYCAETWHPFEMRRR